MHVHVSCVPGVCLLACVCAELVRPRFNTRVAAHIAAQECARAHDVQIDVHTLGANVHAVCARVRKDARSCVCELVYV